jgi:hypothetical protein
MPFDKPQMRLPTSIDTGTGGITSVQDFARDPQEPLVSPLTEVDPTNIPTM